MAEANLPASGDELLTAYLDGELDADGRRALEARLAAEPPLKSRLDALAVSNRPFKDAFGPLLAAAPLTRLQQMIPPAAAPVAYGAPRRGWIAAAAAVVLLGGGIGIGLVMRPAVPHAPTEVADQTPPNWRQVVAEYMSLTTPATLGTMPDNPNLGQALATLGTKLQLDVNADKLMLPMQALKDVRLYDFRGKPLIEAAYLSSDAMSMVAFCIILNGQGDQPLAFEQREGQNIVFWTVNGHGYMVAGTESREQLEALARNLQARFI
jgi:anti-sigma factor RsiW